MFKRPEQRKRVILALGAFLVILAVVSFRLGRYPMSVSQIIHVIGAHFTGERIDASMSAIFFHVRMPRILLSIFVGISLSVAGCCYQGIFRNPLVSSDVIGASSGAAFGAALAILIGLGGAMISISAFAWSIAAVLAVYSIGRLLRENPVLGLVLAGIMVGSLFNAGVSFLKLIADPNNELPAITYWLMGSLAGAKLSEVWPAAVIMLIGLAPLWVIRWRLNLLTMGDEEAKSMGVNVFRLRLLVILCATLMTAASIAVSGMIGWISLVIPHFSRMLVGSDYRTLFPAAALMGADFLLVIDNISRLATTAEIPIGILTAAVGAPFYLYLLTRKGVAA